MKTRKGKDLWKEVEQRIGPVSRRDRDFVEAGLAFDMIRTIRHLRERDAEMSEAEVEEKERDCLAG